MTLAEFKEISLEQFTKEITDQYFLFIEQDKRLFKEYLRVIGVEKDLLSTNKHLGLAIKEHFDLENLEANSLRMKCVTPKSKLIDSYTCHYKVKDDN